MSASSSAGSPKSARPLTFHDQQVALQGTQRGRGDVAVFLAELVADFLVAHIGQQLAEVLQVQEGQAVIVGIFEGNGQHAFLRISQPHQARQQQGAHFGNRRADRVTLFPEQVPEDRRRAGVFIVGETDFLGPRDKLGVERVLFTAGNADAGQVALHIGAEDRNASIGKALGEDLQRDGLAGTGRPGDQAMPV